jgi:hypothetical protein
MFHIILTVHPDALALVMKLCKTFDNENPLLRNGTAGLVHLRLDFRIMATMVTCFAQLEGLDCVAAAELFQDSEPLPPPAREQDTSSIEWSDVEEPNPFDPPSPIILPPLPYCFEM